MSESKKYFLEDLHEHQGPWGGHHVNAKQKFVTPEDYRNKYRVGDGNTPLMLHLFDNIGIEFSHVLDLGAYSSLDSNVFPVMQVYGINGLLIDGANKHRHKNVLREWVTKENIVTILSTNKCPKNLDFLSIDLDNNDYWLLKTVLEAGYVSNVLIFEFNPIFDINESCVKKYDPGASKLDGNTDASSSYGCSLRAVTDLAEKFGYRLIHIIPGENNAVFIQKRFDTKDIYKDKHKTLSALHPEPWIEKHKIKRNHPRFGASTEMRHILGNKCEYIDPTQYALIKEKMKALFENC